MTPLKQESLDFLKQKTNLTEKTIRNKIAMLRRKYPNVSVGGAAHMLAMQYGSSLVTKLSDEDKASIPNLELEASKVTLVKAKSRTKEKLETILNYDTTDPFIKGHVKEINRAFTHGCYTSVNILARKVVENLVIDILIAKYPPEKSKENKEKFYDVAKRRNKDFSEVLRNLHDSRHDFDPPKDKMIQRLYEKAKAFKNQANDKVHSWYYLVKTRKEIEDTEIQVMIDLIRLIQS